MPLVAAMEEWANCRKLPGDAPLHAAVEEFLGRTDGVKLGVTVPQAVEELIAAKEQDGMSQRYLSQLRSVLGLFRKAFPGPIMHVKAEEIDACLRNGKFSPVTRNNRLTILRVASLRFDPEVVGEQSRVADLGGRGPAFGEKDDVQLRRVAALETQGSHRVAESRRLDELQSFEVDVEPHVRPGVSTVLRGNEENSTRRNADGRWMGCGPQTPKAEA